MTSPKMFVVDCENFDQGEEEKKREREYDRGTVR